LKVFLSFEFEFGVAKVLIISDYDYTMEVSTIINFLFLLAAVFYLIIQLGLTAGMKRARYMKNNDHPLISIIVAARNEEHNIDKLLQCLLQQTYKQYEIIIVNDRSKDNTRNIIADLQRNNPKITCIDITSISDDMPAKKNALRAGIEASKGDILCFTDADCFPPPMWIENIVGQFDPEVGIVAGYSPYLIPSDKSFGFIKKLFFKFIAYEEFRAAIWSVGSIGWNLGWLCTGRNFAYRRKVYDDLGGFEKIKMSISGDDDLFLQLVRKQTKWQIRYVLSKETFVPTESPPTFLSFIEQRKRHFSAAKYFSFPMKLFFFFYHISNLLLFISPLLYFIDLLSLTVLIVCICSKLLGDSILVISSTRTFDGYNFRSSFVLMEVLYIFYNILVGSLGLFRKFEWKQI
jgi:cellulose synthase/poly-beta-1,6-N-acetylglucosamine synthase-like glycosyltransferase